MAQIVSFFLLNIINSDSGIYEIKINCFNEIVKSEYVIPANPNVRLYNKCSFPQA